MSVDAKQTMTDLATFGNLSTHINPTIRNPCGFSCPPASRGSNVGWRSAAHWSPASGPGRQPNIWRHLATSGDRPWPFPLFMILRMRRRIQEVPLLLNTKVAMDNTWQYFKAHSIFLERSCTYLQDFARKHLNALVTDPCSLRHHPQHTASWC